MKGNGKVIIAGVDYSAIGNRTSDGFVVMKPRMAWLQIHSLHKKLAEIEARQKRPLSDPNHKELRSLCSECMKIGDKVAVEIVAFKEITTDNFAYKIICSCGNAKKLYTIADSFIEESIRQTPANKKISLAKSPTMRVPAFAPSAT